MPISFDWPFNFNPFNLFQLPQEQFRIFGTATYEVSDGISVYSEGLFTQSTNTTAIAPSGSFGVNAPLPLNNPFLNDNIRNIICGAQGISQADCDAAGATPFGPSQPNPLADQNNPNFDPNAPATIPNPDFLAPITNIARRFVELGPRLNELQTRLFQVKIGARGDITDNIEFDLFAAYGESDLRSAQSGNGTRTRFDQSLFSIDPNNCIDPSGGCVPINVFGPVGSITPEVGTFLDVGNFASTSTSLGQVQGFISGDLGISVPSASQPINFVIGGEYRDYTAFTSSDLLSQTPGEVLGNGAANPDQGGGYDVYEAFGELVVPILSDVSFAKSLTLELGGRISDYSTTGSEFTWKAGGSWEVVDGFTIRGNFQQVTRAPNIGELFTPVQTGLGNNSNDPCHIGNAALAAVCDAQVLAGGGFPGFNNAGVLVPADIAGQVNVTAGGNPNLGSEDADTWTVGFILQPNAVPGLSITADYYNIQVSGAVSAPSEDDVITACFGPGSGTAGAPNLPAGAATSLACSLIQRNADTGSVAGPVASTPGFLTQISNLGEIATDGVDVSINYSRDIGFANLLLNWNGNWTNSSTFQANPAAIDRECVGFFSSNCGSIQPELSFAARSTFQFDNVDVSLLWRYIDSVELEPIVFDSGAFLGSPGSPGAVDGSPFTDFTQIGAEHYFDLSVRAQPSDNVSITLAVLNLFDNDPTVVGSDIGSTAFNSGNVFPSTYDPLGRRFSLTARLTF